MPERDPIESKVSRRDFVARGLLASAGAGLALEAQAAGPAAGAPSAVAPTAAGAGLPRGKIGNLEISRLLLGGNLLTHFTHSRDLRYVYSLAKHYNTEEKILETLALAEANGINTLVIHTAPGVLKFIEKHRKRGGKIQAIICSIAPIEPGLAKYGESVQRTIDEGADAIYVWGVASDKLLKEGKADLIGKAVELAKAQGVPSGVGAHETGVVKYCEQHKIPADFYIKTFHHLKYPSVILNHDSQWCQEPDELASFMRGVTKPWIAFKVMAAGAIPPKDAFQYAFANGADFVLAGMFDFEIAEDVSIAKNAFAGAAKRARPWCA